MFTGIITDIGSVVAIDKKGEKTFTLRTALPVRKLAVGASVACDGCCLTVVRKSTAKKTFDVQVSQETLSCTTLGGWKPSRRVNLERTLRVGDELGGHFVTGHVDAVAVIDIIETVGESKVIRFVVDDGEMIRLIAPKGSVTLDGVSLTVNEVKGNRFSVNVIPHTLGHTTLGLKKPGDALNLEIDLIARYLARPHA